MVITMQFCVLSCIILSTCHGFLLTNKTGIPSIGTNGLTDGHYLILTDALSVQKQLLTQMETFVLQLQNEFKTLKQEVKDLKSMNNVTQSLAVAPLKKESANHSLAISALKKESASQSLVISKLKNDTSEARAKSTRLQNINDILQKKFDTLQKENNVLKHDNAVIKIQISNWNNFSVYINKELNSFTHSIAATNIQNVTSIQSNMDSLTSQMKTLNSQISTLVSTSTSRSQDFLALLNKTNAADIKLKTVDSRSQTFQNHTEKRIDSLEQNFVLVSNEIRTVKGKVQEINTIAFTSCATTSVDYNDGQVIRFPNTVTSVGINSMTEFSNTGRFTCEKSGVYLFSVFIGYNGHSYADFLLMKNGSAISRVMVVYGANSGQYYSGSGTIVVQLNVGDILQTQAWRHMNVASSSCFTLLKIN